MRSVPLDLLSVAPVEHSDELMTPSADSIQTALLLLVVALTCVTLSVS